MHELINKCWNSNAFFFREFWTHMNIVMWIEIPERSRGTLLTRYTMVINKNKKKMQIIICSLYLKKKHTQPMNIQTLITKRRNPEFFLVNLHTNTHTQTLTHTQVLKLRYMRQAINSSGKVGCTWLASGFHLKLINQKEINI